MFGIETYADEKVVYLFFCIFLLVGIYIWSYHWKAAKIAAFAHIDSIRKIADAVSLPKKILKRTLICAAYLLLVFALMRPQGNPDRQLPNATKAGAHKKITASLSLADRDKDKKGGRKVKVRESARDIIFLLDVSASMGAEDLYPNRLSKAKDLIRDVVAALDGEHVGLVIFTSVPSVKCILTLDYTYFKRILDDVVINDNDYAGTKLMPALHEIIDRQFDFSKNKYKDLFIITDGGDTDLEGLKGEDRRAFAERLADLAESAFKKKGIRIHTIGLGSKAGTIIMGVKNADGKPVRSSLNEKLLMDISQKARGVYVPVEDSNVDMKKIYTDKIAVTGPGDLLREREIRLDRNKLKELVRKQKEEEERRVVYEEFYIYPLGLAIILLLLEFFISEKKAAYRRNSYLR